MNSICKEASHLHLLFYITLLFTYLWECFPRAEFPQFTVDFNFNSLYDTSFSCTCESLEKVPKVPQLQQKTWDTVHWIFSWTPLTIKAEAPAQWLIFTCVCKAGEVAPPSCFQVILNTLRLAICTWPIPLTWQKKNEEFPGLPVKFQQLRPKKWGDSHFTGCWTAVGKVEMKMWI